MRYPPPPEYPPAYQPVQPPVTPRRTNGLGVASLIIGIVAFIGAFVPFVDYATGVLAFVGLVLGVVGLFLAGRAKGAAIVGTILNVVAIAASVILAIVYTVVFFGVTVHSNPALPAPDGESVPLVYQVDGSGSDATITYTTYTDDIPGAEQLTGQALPFEEDLTVKVGAQHTYNSYTLTATNGASDGDVTCRIVLDGEVLISQTSSGPYSTASCTASGTQLLE
ncbi:hypothetical protein ACEXOS_005690 [Herbiconiux sp. P16]|uniref:hypothetical protein n=1 Tax=Herbiconiux wuyangfengii TaxID=3342794 RepID=UPI0035B9786B